MLYDQDRHETICSIKWSEEKVRSTLIDIFDRTIQNFDPFNFWPKDPDEDSPTAVNKSIYFGAAGTLWALEKLSIFLKKDLPFDKSILISSIYEQYISTPDTENIVPSFFLGEVGILLINYKYDPSFEIENRLFQIIKENIENPTIEALWGAPGTMLGASYMYEHTKDKKWLNLYLENVQFLLSTWHEDAEKGYSIWTQDLYNKILVLVGAGHGFMGNIFPLLKDLKLVSTEDRTTILSKALQTTKKLAIEENNIINWPVTDKKEDRKWLVQWCHGAPGAITSLSFFPKDMDAELEVILEKAGELIWQAGPLRKKIALCHGTDGNGFAFLKLYKRTGNTLWLDRARQFAMHAIEQRNGRYTLFTGELGLAMYLVNCIKGEDDFPMLDTI